MITTRLQFEEWIKDNGFSRWIFYKSDPTSKSEGDRSNDKITDSKFYAGSIEQKIDMTCKYLEQWGNIAYGVAYQTETASTGGTIATVRLESTAQQTAQPTAGVGAVDAAALMEQCRKEIRLEFEQREYEKQRKQLDDDIKEFNRDKESAIGALVGFMKPVLSAMATKRVAGVDAPDEVAAARIRAVDTQDPDSQEPIAESPFTDEEADKLFDLMARFQKVEPQYMQLIESVVKMAESGDQTYAMARGFLIK